MSLFALDDPRQAGLLSLGLNMLTMPGDFSQAFGRSGLNAISDMQQAQQLSQAKKLREMQIMQAEAAMKDAQRQRDQQQRTDTYLQDAYTPVSGIKANQASGVVGPRPEALKSVGQTRGFNFAEAVRAGVPIATALQLEQQFAKDNTPISVGEGTTLLDKRTLKPVFTNPKTEKDDGFVRLMKAAGIEPESPEGRALLQAKVQKDATHQPPVSVSYGAPVAGVDAQGNPVFFQPDKGGGTPSIVPGVKPAPQNRDTKLPAELQRMQIAGDAMSTLMSEYEGMLKKHNPRDPMVQASPQIRADMQALKRNIELQFKELQALGALAGPDIDIIRQSLSDPFTVSGAYYGRDGLLSQVARARQLVKARSDAVMKSQGQQPKSGKQIKRTGTAPDGRKVVEYTDGSIEYAD